MNVLIISRIIPSHEIASKKTTYYAIDKTLRLATPDSGIPQLTLSGDFCLKLGKLALEVGLLSRDLIAQCNKRLFAYIRLLFCVGPAGDRVAHGGVGKVVAFRRGGPAGMDPQGISGRGGHVASLTAGRRAAQADRRH